MSDDLEDLKQAMKAATPDPDTEVRAAHLRLAEKKFADLQGSHGSGRLMSNRPKRGFWTGAFAMLNTLTSRAVLTATTAVVAFGIVLVNNSDLEFPRLRDRDAPVPTEVTERLDAPAMRRHEQTPEAEDAFADLQPAPAEQSGELDLATAEPRLRRSIGPGSGEAKHGVGAAIAPLAGLAMDQAMPARPRPATDHSVVLPETDTEAYANAPANPLRITAETPVSTFSIDVDTASYAVVRNSLMSGRLPDPDAVRIEEMINYFPYDYPAPDGAAFRPSVSVSATPWNPDTKLVHIGIQGAVADMDAGAPLNLVFLIDTSGSMNHPDKLPMLVHSFRLMLGQLRPHDQVSIVTYAGSAGQVLAPTAASERQVILNALERLGAGGSTAGQAGLQQAYATASAMTKEGDVTRVILATDGDFNVGISDPDALKSYISGQRDRGVYLSVLGFGRGNLDDATMQALAQNGNGQAAYIDTLAEAQKVLVDQLTGALFPIADDVKIQVEFNPAQVAEYRLIGYETRALRREDFNNDAVDAGDIGAGHSVTALYEVTPVGSPAQFTQPLRYQAAPSSAGGDELGFLALRYKAPGTATSELIEMPITADTASVPDAGFAAAIAGFGQLLRDSVYIGDWTYQDAMDLAIQTKGDDPFGYRAEAIQLMRLAASLSEN